MDIDIILEADVTPAQVSELAQLAERYGIRGIWTQNYSNARDAFMCLMPAATTTRKILLGAVVISPYEMHPLKIANAVSTLHEYSSGRAMVVIGGGGEWPGIMGMQYGRRVTGLGEAIGMVKRAVTGEVVKWDGQVYSARYFKSTWVLKDKAPLIYAGATGPQMMAMATRVADGTMLSDMCLPMLPKTAQHIRDGLTAAKRPVNSFRVNNFCAFHVKKDKEASFRESRRELMIRGWLEQEWLEAFLTPAEVEVVNAKKDAFLTAFRTKSGDIKGVPPEIVAKLVEGLSLAGDLGDIDRHVERMRKFEAGGMTENALRVHDDPADSIRIIGEHVVPKLR
jgi:alkanesulfonate monooxygenase SsuD/methylene tetrahydromethanopterin reductase-like flavin-dependent oxidoreductase (luciferase family)